MRTYKAVCASGEFILFVNSYRAKPAITKVIQAAGFDPVKLNISQVSGKAASSLIAAGAVDLRD